MGSIALTKQRQYVIVLGGSYVGTKAAEQLSLELPDEYHVVLIEKNSHFQHIFAFPRFAVTTDVDTHKAFIPYGSHTFGGRQTASFIQARVTELNGSSVHLDRQVELNGSRVDAIPYAFLVIATGTKLSPPSSIPGTEKLDGVGYLRRHAETVRRSSRIVIIGGGAVGVQTATDIKELYPSKDVTLIHSRKHVMNTFDPRFHDIIAERFAELGIESILGSRVKVPSAGFPVDAQSIVIECEDGTTIPADFVIISTGQTPQSELMTGLSPNSIDAGFIKTLPTLQLDNPTFPNIFVVGDVAATRAHKAAKPAYKQVEIVTRNIQHLISGEALEDYKVTDPAAIHLTLGIQKSVVFRNPESQSSEPFVKWKDDGTLDMAIDSVWARRGGGSNL